MLFNLVLGVILFEDEEGVRGIEFDVIVVYWDGYIEWYEVKVEVEYWMEDFF